MGRVCAATTLAPTRSADPIEGSMIEKCCGEGRGRGGGGEVVRSRGREVEDATCRFKFAVLVRGGRQ